MRACSTAWTLRSPYSSPESAMAATARPMPVPIAALSVTAPATPALAMPATSEVVAESRGPQPARRRRAAAAAAAEAADDGLVVVVMGRGLPEAGRAVQPPRDTPPSPEGEASARGRDHQAHQRVDHLVAAVAQ